MGRWWSFSKISFTITPLVLKICTSSLKLNSTFRQIYDDKINRLKNQPRPKSAKNRKKNLSMKTIQSSLRSLIIFEKYLLWYLLLLKHLKRKCQALIISRPIWLVCLQHTVTKFCPLFTWSCINNSSVVKGGHFPARNLPIIVTHNANKWFLQPPSVHFTFSTIRPLLEDDLAKMTSSHLNNLVGGCACVCKNANQSVQKAEPNTKDSRGGGVVTSF